MLKMAAFLGIHTCSLGAPILLEEAKAAEVRPQGTFNHRHADLRQTTRERRLERGMDTVLQPRPGMDRTIYGGGHPRL